jgi:ribosomal protein S3
MFHNSVKNVIQLWKEDSHLHEPIMYDINYDTKKITIYTTRPGWMIGMAGKRVNEYTEKMKQVWSLFEGFLFKEVQEWVY